MLWDIEKRISGRMYTSAYTAVASKDAESGKPALLRAEKVLLFLSGGQPPKCNYTTNVNKYVYKYVENSK